MAPWVTFIFPLGHFHVDICCDWLMIDGLVSVAFSYEITPQWTAESAAAERERSWFVLKLTGLRLLKTGP